MSKKDFLKKLNRALSTLPRDEREKTIAYYDELIEDRKEAGYTEEAAVDAMGDVKTIANDIIADAKERGVEIKRRGMPTAVKVVLIVLAVLCVITMLTGGVAAVIKGLAGNVSTEWNPVSVTFEVGSKSFIRIDMEEYDLTVAKSQDGKIHLSYFVNDDLVVFTVNETDDALEISERKKNAVSWFIPNQDNRRAELLIPEGFTGTLVSDTATGDTNIDGITTVIAYVVRTTTGDLSVGNVTAQSATFRVTTGELNFSHCSFGNDIHLIGTTGEFTVYNVEAASVSVKTTTGSAKVKNVKADEVEVGMTTGSMTVENVSAGRIYLHATTGEIRVDGLDSNDIKITATTGSVSGTLIGSIEDYTIESHVSTGMNSLPNNFGEGERKLYVKTTTGSIRLTFGG